MIVKRSASAYADTVSRLLEAIEERDLTVFARIDHAAGARAAGLELASEEVVAFGNPRAGTPLMQSDPRVGIELPLRILAWEDDPGHPRPQHPQHHPTADVRGFARWLPAHAPASPTPQST